jgi:N-acetylmuramoyl-L-alanine amidase
LEKLGREDLAQLRKRIVKVKHLEALSAMETHGYVRKRMTAAGHRGKSLFEPGALALIAERSQGIPRDINKICSRALLEAYARGLYTVTEDIVEKAERNLAAAGGPTDTDAEEIEGVSADLQWTGKEAKQFSLPGSGVWVAAILGVLLSGGLALPHGMLRGMTQIMRGQQAVLASPEQREEATQQPASPARPVINALAKPAISTKRSLNADTPTGDVAEALPESRYGEGGQLSLTRELGLKINRIVIDPGHGGSDTGAKGPHGLLEKDLCLDVALRLGQMIEESIHGAEVVYTRRDDSYVPLEERTAIANGAGADLFISIHANSSDSREVRGVETYYLSLATSREAKELAIRENALTQSSLHDLPDLVQKITRNEKIAESRLLALEIQDTLTQRLQLVSRREKNRGVKQAPFIVLAGANMPAVLSEISFVSNANDESLLLESGQRQRIAEGLYRGIAVYLDGLHGPSESKQKLITENRGKALSGFERSSSEGTRNPL